MKHINYLATAMLLLCLNFTQRTAAQTTGSYDTTISFMSSNRALSLYVPTTYSAVTPHRLMICLHGLGDTCTSYRNALISSLAWNTNMPNTIFICPEAFARNADYYYPTGGEDIIQSCIDFARARYNVDTTNIILQGFSLGGRAALRYGLDNYSRFRGLLLNTPAMQGVKQALNGTSYPFNYTNSRRIPIYMTHGATDLMYTGPIDTTYMSLILNDGKVRYRDVAGLGHTIPAFSAMSDCISFINEPRAAGTDLHVVAPVVAPRSCVTTVPASCLVRNTGTDTIHSITLNYNTGSGTMTHSWTGTLGAYEHAIIALPALRVAGGTTNLSISAATVNGAADTITTNNSTATTFMVQTAGLPVPYTEGFEGAFPPANWVRYTAGDLYARFDLDNEVKKTGTGSMFAFNTILLFDNADRKEEIALPLLDLTSAPNPHMLFDVSYNYHHYLPPVTLVDTAFADTLSVMISTDCGATYSTVYKKGGAQLATYANPILNPLSISATYADPADSNWRTEDIDLTVYAGAGNAILKISYKSAIGGSLNIDNVTVNNGGLAVKELSKNIATLYPNPATDQITIAAGNTTITEVAITDMAGRILMNIAEPNKGNVTVNTAALTNGMYMARTTTSEGFTASTFVINR